MKIQLQGETLIIHNNKDDDRDIKIMFLFLQFSNVCKHTFSKNAILQLISRNGNVVGCPIPGKII